MRVEWVVWLSASNEVKARRVASRWVARAHLGNRFAFVELAQRRDGFVARVNGSSDSMDLGGTIL